MARLDRFPPTLDGLNSLNEAVHNDGTVHPNEYKSDNLEDCLNNWLCNIKGIDERDTEAKLTFLREACLTATASKPSKIKQPSIQETTYLWIKFLTSRSSSTENFFLQHFRAQDKSFYERGTLRVKRRREWPACWKCNNNHSGKLRWLKNPQKLTITEFEIALAIFDWDTPKPSIAWWLRSYPHILLDVHTFLLQRYCFALLRPLRKAMKNSTRDFEDTADTKKAVPIYRAPHLASPAWRLYPRVGGLTALGFLGLIGIIEPVASNWLQYNAILKGFFGVISLALLFFFLILDVFNQNRGVISRTCHALPRTFGALWRFLIWSICWEISIITIRGISSASKLGLSWHKSLIAIVYSLENLTEILAIVGATAFLGALVQWIWEDVSAIEPL